MEGVVRGEQRTCPTCGASWNAPVDSCPVCKPGGPTYIEQILANRDQAKAKQRLRHYEEMAQLLDAEADEMEDDDGQPDFIRGMRYAANTLRANGGLRCRYIGCVKHVDGMHVDRAGDAISPFTRALIDAQIARNADGIHCPSCGGVMVYTDASQTVVGCNWCPAPAADRARTTGGEGA